MLGIGESASYADAVLELVRSFNEGGLRAMKQPRTAQNTTPTTLQEFAGEVFRKAYETETAARAIERDLRYVGAGLGGGRRRGPDRPSVSASALIPTADLTRISVSRCP
jgi:hypothetical protein